MNTFTIIATVRNEAATICGFVESLLAQSRAPDEVVIVDGQSTDGTTETLREYEGLGQIRLIVQDCNIAQGRNLGIAAAAGSHIAVTDAGCIIDPGWLRHIADCFETDAEIDVVAGNFRFETHTPFEQAVVLATFQPKRDESESARYYPSSRSVAFRKTAWERAGGYPEWLYAAEDTLFNIRMRQVGCHFRFCKEAIVRWRPRENWRALARQRVNFARGNARVGIGTAGYRINLAVHTVIAALLIGGLWSPWLLAAAAVVFAWHVRRHLWQHAAATTAQRGPAMRLRVLAVMEFVRVVSLWGFLRGRWERVSDTSFVERQRLYMGITSVEELKWA